MRGLGERSEWWERGAEGRGGGEYGSGVRKGWCGELMRGEGRWGKGVDEMRG